MIRCIIIRLQLTLAGALMLAACQTVPPVRDRIVEVKVPIAVQPITPEQKPVVPAPLGPRPATLPQAADLLLSKWCEAVAYFLKADPLLSISAGLEPSELHPFPECETR